MAKIFASIFLFCVLVGGWYVHSEINTAEARGDERITFEVKPGESVRALAERLSSEQIIRNGWLFRKYVQYTGKDTSIHAGVFAVEKPITLKRVVEALSAPGATEEDSVTILPGWSLYEIAEYLEKKGLGTQDEFFALVGKPAFAYTAQNAFASDLTVDVPLLDHKPKTVSLEGYLAPDTFRIYKDAMLQDVVAKLLQHRNKQFTEQMYADIEKSGRTVHEVLTVASLVEREVRGEEDRKKVADLFWRRYDVGMALQADSTVHYVVNKKGNVFTSKEDRDTDNPWNTYKYPGLPPGPIATPSLSAIMATIYPEKNDYWYFLTDLKEGNVYYGKNLNEHNANVQKYLR